MQQMSAGYAKYYFISLLFLRAGPPIFKPSLGKINLFSHQKASTQLKSLPGMQLTAGLVQGA